MKPICGEVDPMAVSPVHPKQSVVAARIESELVLLDVDQGTYFGLDELGTEIWESISSGGDTDELVARLVEEYDVSPEQLRVDIAGFLDELEDKGLVSAANA